MKRVQLIAEFCQNHNGKMDLLARMVESAAKAGATHGKMQTIFANTISWRPQFEEGLVIDGVTQSIKRPFAAEYKRLKKLEISQIDTIRFVELCKQNGLIPVTTCFARANCRDIAQAGFKVVKVASYDCGSYQLLRELVPFFENLIVSTGASFDDEVLKAANCLQGKAFSFLHCVTLYPTPINETHLRRMEWLKELTPTVGFSDHSLIAQNGLTASKAALALGADIVERHFTILGPSETRDGPISVNFSQMHELANFASLSREEQLERMNRDHPGWEIVLGQRHRHLSHDEMLNRDYYRGRFGSPRPESSNGKRLIFNWEETPLS